MKVDEFCQELKDRADAFCIMWEAGQKENPDGYPVELEDSEWFEQFLAYLED